MFVNIYRNWRYAFDKLFNAMVIAQRQFAAKMPPKNTENKVIKRPEKQGIQ